MHIRKISWSLLVFSALPALLAAAPATAAEATLFVGMGKPTEAETEFDYGLSLAGSVGGRLIDRLSLHGQLQFALLDPQVTNTSGNYFQAGVLPLVHVLGDGQRTDVVAGLNLGVYRAAGELSVLGFSADGWEWGLQTGFLVGALFQVSHQFSLGLYLQYALLFPQEACVEGAGTSACNEDPEDDKGFLSFGVGAGF
jgi:hypothetical protein